jgi:hypothetical protein
MPDDELFLLASRKQLQSDSVLAAQVERMIQSPKFRYIGNSLGAEWLKYDQVGVRNRPDPIDNKFMTDSLYTAMKKESSMFLTYLFKVNRPVEELINARYTFLNEELARFYRIGGIKGQHMRPVRLKTLHRGGILSHASILMVTSHPERASPILRGNWILSDLLGTPPPPPPADVGELEEEGSFENRLKKHSSQKQCAGCHSKIDPLGLALGNFDKMGRKRSSKKRTVTLDDGSKFTGLQGLKTLLTTQKVDILKRNIVERTLSFALGRQLGYFDEPAVRKILKKIKKSGSGFKDILVGIVQSYPFKYNRNSKGESP